MEKQQKWSVDGELRMDIPDFNTSIDNPLHLSENLDFSKIETYVHDIISAMPIPELGSKLTYKTSETHRFIYIMIKIPKSSNIGEWRIMVNSSRLNISNPTRKVEQTIILPARANPYKCTALLKEQVLQIKISKDLNKETYHNVTIKKTR
jgi:hypothetical protein